MERISFSRSFSRQLQDVLKSSQSHSYLKELGLTSHDTFAPVTKEEEQKNAVSVCGSQGGGESHKAKRIKLVKRKAEGDDVSFASTTPPAPKRIKLKTSDSQNTLREKPHSSNDTGMQTNMASRGDTKAQVASSDAPALNRCRLKEVKRQRDENLRQGAAKFEAILKKGFSEFKKARGLLERLVDAKEEKKVKETGESVVASQSMKEHSSRSPQSRPPLWSTSLQDLQAAEELCPDLDSKRGKVGVKLSRGGIARAVLFSDASALQRQRLDSRGVVYFDVILPTAKKNKRACSVKQNMIDDVSHTSSTGQATPQTCRGKLEAPMSIYEPAPIRRSFIERRMARRWVYQEQLHQSPPPQAVGPPPPPAVALHDGTDEQSGCDRLDIKKASPDDGIEGPDRSESPLHNTPTVVSNAVLRDATIEGLLEAYRLDTPVYIFLFGRCACDKSSPPECSCYENTCGALPLLPCKLPKRVQAVGVGWSSVLNVENLGHAQPTFRFHLRLTSSQESPWWWLPHPKQEKGWKLPRHPPWITHSPMPHVPKGGLLSALVCRSCKAAVLRLSWAGWHCLHCGLCILAAPLKVREDVGWGRMPILTEGPRMDNGRVLCVPPIARKDIKTWPDGIKVVDYTLPANGNLPRALPLRDARTGQTTEELRRPVTRPDIRLHHFLSCGEWRRKCDRLLSQLLGPSMPYERHTNLSGQLQSFFSLAFYLTAGSREHLTAFVPSPMLDVDQHTSTADILLDAVEEVEELVSRIYGSERANPYQGAVHTRTELDERPLTPFSTLTTIVADVKNKLELLTSTSSSTSSAKSANVSTPTTTKKKQIVYLHLGSPSILKIAINTQHASNAALIGSDPGKVRRPFLPLLNGMIAHGDVFLLRCDAQSDYKIIVESQNLHVGLIFT